MVDLLLEFAAFWAVAYVIGATIMFVVCFGVLAVNRRFPERKIQKRPQTHSARKDILSSLRQIAVTAFCLAFGLFAQWKGWTIAPVPRYGAMRCVERHDFLCLVASEVRRGAMRCGFSLSPTPAARHRVQGEAGMWSWMHSGWRRPGNS